MRHRFATSPYEALLEANAGYLPTYYDNRYVMRAFIEAAGGALPRALVGDAQAPRAALRDRLQRADRRVPRRWGPGRGRGRRDGP